MHSFAAKSDEELVLLRNVARHLADVKPKLVYADWLKAHGHMGREKFLRKIIVAHESLDIKDLPSFDSVDECWARMIGATYLRAFVEYAKEIDETKRAGLRDLIFKSAEPSIVVQKGPSVSSLEIGRSRCFGLPDMPVGLNWPSYGDCQHDFEDTGGAISLEAPTFFACQIRTGELKPFIAGDLAANDKLLYFFTFVETEQLGSQSVCVLASDDLDSLETRNQPSNVHADNCVQKPISIRFSEALSLPYDGGVFSGQLKLEQFGKFGPEMYDIVKSTDGFRGNRMFGYLQSSSGGDPTPTPNHRRLILVEGPGSGVVHLGIDLHDLENQDWKKGCMVWNDWGG